MITIKSIILIKLTFVLRSKKNALPRWPVFEADKPTVMQFNDGASLISVPNQQRIKLIDGFMTHVRTGK